MKEFRRTKEKETTADNSNFDTGQFNKISAKLCNNFKGTKIQERDRDQESQSVR